MIFYLDMTTPLILARVFSSLINLQVINAMFMMTLAVDGRRSLYSLVLTVRRR